MADLVYRSVMRDIKHKILNGDYANMKLPDERSLSSDYGVSRSSIKRALGILAQQGIIFKKRGSGTFINPLYLKNQAMFRYEGSNLGITDSFKLDGKKQGIKLLNYQVVQASQEIQQDLFLNDNDFVYRVIFQLKSCRHFRQPLSKDQSSTIWKNHRIKPLRAHL